MRSAIRSTIEMAIEWARSVSPGHAWACLLVTTAPGVLAGDDGGTSPFPLPRPSNTLEYNASNPGARSLGMAGAFVALADDATAAFSNPAGLVQLSKPEIMLEGRHWSYSTAYTVGGRAAGEPIGRPIDTSDGLIHADSEEGLSGLAYLSFVYPRRKWSVALYRHQLYKYRSVTEVNGLFGEFSLVPGVTVQRQPDQQAVLDVDVVSYGVSGSYKITEKLFVGVGLVYYVSDVRATIHGYTYCRPLAACLTDEEEILAENAFDPDDVITVSNFDQRDEDWSFNAGFLWRFHEKWSLGGNYRAGADFAFDVEILAGPALSDISIPPGAVLEFGTGTGSISNPDIYSLGMAYGPTDALRISFDWVRVEYSDVADATLDNLEGNTIRPFEEELLVVDDADEFRLGAEYTVAKTNPIVALRAGLWRDPAHRAVSQGDDPFSDAYYPEGDDAFHVAAGVGVKFERVQLDFGVDVSDPVDTIALSVLYQFGFQ